MRCIFIVNPVAGSGKRTELLNAQLKVLSEAGRCEIYRTKAAGDAETYVRKVIAENPGEELRFIACGGDGTMNCVFSQCVGHENVSVSLYPCGSGNDFVKNYGEETFLDPEALIDAPVRRIDVLKVGDRYSFNVANFGFDALVAITVNEDRDKNGHGSKSSYFKGVLKALVKGMKNKAKVWADGELLNEDGIFLLCTCANGQYVGGSFRCAPRAGLDDGLIEVCLAKTVSRLTFLRCVRAYMEGSHLENPLCMRFMIYRQARSVRVEAPEEFSLCLDGEIVPGRAFEISMLPAAVRLAVPEKGSENDRK